MWPTPQHAVAAILVGVLSLTGARFCAAQNQEWQVFRAIHFLVYYRDDAAFAEKVANRVEEEYVRMRGDLGFTKATDLWLWDNRVKIRIYDSQEEMTSTNGLPKWAVGGASYWSKEIFIINSRKSAVDRVLVHELAHLVFRDSLGWQRNAPVWINEGIAQWLESEDSRKKAQKMIVDTIRRNELIPLNRITAVLDGKDLKDDEVGRFYAESVSVVGYLIAAHGAEKFKRLCTLLRNGMRLDDAINFTYNPTLHNLDEMEKAWKESLGSSQ